MNKNICDLCKGEQEEVSRLNFEKWDCYICVGCYNKYQAQKQYLYKKVILDLDQLDNNLKEDITRFKTHKEYLRWEDGISQK